jgi:hypothetical protein
LTLKPSVRAVFLWANGRFSAHWPGLFAIGLLAQTVPILRMALEHGNRKALHPWVGLGIAGLEELMLLLCTAAMMLLVTGPDPARATDALRSAFHDSPRLVAVRVATALAQWAPAIGLALLLRGARSVVLTFVVSIVMVPLGFVCRLAFAGAVVERTGPLVALRNAFRRASFAGLGSVFAFAILIIALIEQVPPLIWVWIANQVFPPELVTVPPPFPPGTFPSGTFPAGTFPFSTPVPGRFGSGIPWAAYPVIRILMIPIFAYVATLFAGAALDFADADPNVEQKPVKAGIVPAPGA